MATESIRILYADDDLDRRDRVIEFVERQQPSMDVVSAYCVDEALERLRSRRFDCVVSGRVAPGPENRPFLALVAEYDPDIPRILLSADSDSPDARVDDAVETIVENGNGEALRPLLDAVEDAVGRPSPTPEPADRRSLSALFENVPDPVVRYRFESGEPIVEAINRAFETVFGYEESEVVGSSIDGLLLPENGQSEGKNLNRRVKRGEQLDAQVRRETAGGPREFLLRNAAIPTDSEATRGYAIYTDVTERTTHERRLQRLHGATRRLVGAGDREDVARVAVETARDVLDLPHTGVFFADESAGVIGPVANTDDAREELGPPPTFPLGEGIVGWVYDHGERVVLDDVRTDERKYAGGTSAIRSYCAFPLGDHGVMTIASPDIGAFDDNDVRIAAILAGNVETTLDRADREATLRERERELSHKNDRLEEFAGIVSHDLRNPLNLAQGHLELLREECESPHLDDVGAAHERMHELIENVLALSRHGALRDVGPVDLEIPVRRAWASVPGDGATLHIDDLQTVRADEAALVRLFENLFRNAVEHVGEGVTVTVGPLADGDGIYVEDDGPGVPADERDRLFEPSYTTSPDGTGFGLAIVEEIASAHGWTVSVTDGTDGGARFEFARREPFES